MSLLRGSTVYFSEEVIEDKDFEVVGTEEEGVDEVLTNRKRKAASPVQDGEVKKMRPNTSDTKPLEV